MAHEQYHEAARFLEGLNNLTQRQNAVYRRTARAVFQRYSAFLTFLGHPERGFKVVHVAGTNGKGTTTNLIHTMLHEDGRRVGSFYSPYVTTPLDSIVINDRYLAPNVFTDLVWELKDALERFIQRKHWDAPSYFELKTAMAFLAFKHAHAEWIVLETGLGGELDATNALARKEAAVITNIGWDHAHIIGPRLADIAAAKGGIITPGTKHVVTGEQRPRFVRYFAARAKKIHATFDAVHIPKISGPHTQNGQVADAVAERLGISMKARLAAHDNARLPGRFERISKQPTVILDTAHNEGKIRFFASRIAELPAQKRILVFSCAASKDGTAMLKIIAQYADGIILTRYSSAHRKCHDLGILYRSLPPRMREKTEILLHPTEAIARATARAGKSGLVIVTGSTFLVGDIRAVYIPETDILRQRTSFPLHAKRR